jgi:hypothetical protein
MARTYRSPEQLSMAEVLRPGLAVPDVHDWRDRVTKEHVFWLLTFDGDKIAVLRYPDGKMKELSLGLSQKIWPRVLTKHVGPLNRQLLPNGHTIPIIPDSFFEYKKKNQVKSREARKHRRSVPPSASLVPWGRLRPSVDEARRSWYYAPPTFFAANASAGEPPHEARRRVVALLRAYCATGTAHPNGGFLTDDIGLATITSVDELKNFPYSRVLMQMFHFLGASADGSTASSGLPTSLCPSVLPLRNGDAET